MLFAEYRSQLSELCSLAYQRQLVYASDGNFSMRLPDDCILITPSKRNKGMVGPDEMIVAKLDGIVVEGSSKVSSEFPMHRHIYLQRSDINVVLHSHPAYATAFASSGRQLPDNYFIEAALLLDKVPTTAYATPGTFEMVSAIEPFVSTTNNLLLKNHGAVVYDTTGEQAFNRLEVLETVCRMVCYTEQFGGASVITPSEMARLTNSPRKEPTR